MMNILFTLLVSIALSVWAFKKGTSGGDYDIGILFWLPMAALLFVIPWLVFFIIF